MAFWINRVGAVFTVGFSVVFLVMLGASAGNQRVATLGGIRLVDYYVPGFIAYGVMAAGFTTLAITLVVRRETGLLKRLRLSPLPTWVLIASIFISTTIVAFAQVVVLLLIGRYGYQVAFPTSWLALVVAVVIGIVSFSAMGEPGDGRTSDEHRLLRAALPRGTLVPTATALGTRQVLRLPAGAPPHHRDRPVVLDPARRFAVGVARSPGRRALGLGATIVALRRFPWSPRRS